MEAKMKPTIGGYADANSIKLYHEAYGQGETPALIPGRLTTIGEIERWVQALAKTRPVIAVEMQGHGRTADTDRPISFATMGDDIAALLNYLGDSESRLGRPFVRRRQSDQRRDSASGQGATAGSNLLALCQSGWYPEAQKGMSRISASMAGNNRQIIETMARAAALSALPRQDGEDDDRGL